MSNMELKAILTHSYKKVAQLKYTKQSVDRRNLISGEVWDCYIQVMCLPTFSGKSHNIKRTRKGLCERQIHIDNE